MEAASGAIREAGKLFVFLSDDDLVQMIKMKDAQLQTGGEEGNVSTLAEGRVFNRALTRHSGDEVVDFLIEHLSRIAYRERTT
jgi:hypothetical protein